MGSIAGALGTTNAIQKTSIETISRAGGRRKRHRPLAEMARITRRSRQHRLAGLLFLVTTASALSLSNFQIVDPSSVPFNCLHAYDQPLQTCTSKDFRSGRACSSGCAAELASSQGRLQQACNGADVSADSLLGQALEGNLVPLLCPNDANAGGNPTQSTATVTTSRIVSTETLSRTSGRLSTLSPLKPTQAPKASPTGDGLPVTPQAAPSPTETTAAQKTQSSSDDKPEVNPGGSPFDLVGGSPTVSAPWTGALAVAVGITVLLFR